MRRYAHNAKGLSWLRYIAVGCVESLSTGEAQRKNAVRRRKKRKRRRENDKDTTRTSE
jgi:hypothetical protein